MKHIQDIAGHIFGNLTVIHFSHITQHITYWLCKCTCGQERICCVVNIKRQARNKRKSCYCFRNKTVLSINGKHRAKYSTQVDFSSKEYQTWTHIKNRCLNTKANDYTRYGGRGIRIHNEWVYSFENFLKYVGNSPTPSHSLDRINNNGHYEPGNVKWSTPKEQSNNRRNTVMISYHDQLKPLRFWCDELHLSYDLVRYRLYLGWPVHRAFFEPPRHRARRP